MAAGRDNSSHHGSGHANTSATREKWIGSSLHTELGSLFTKNDIWPLLKRKTTFSCVGPEQNNLQGHSKRDGA